MAIHQYPWKHSRKIMYTGSCNLVHHIHYSYFPKFWKLKVRLETSLSMWTELKHTTYDSFNQIHHFTSSKFWTFAKKGFPSNVSLLLCSNCIVLGCVRAGLWWIKFTLNSYKIGRDYCTLQWTGEHVILNQVSRTWVLQLYPNWALKALEKDSFEYSKH